jgi:hypothetical protein
LGSVGHPNVGAAAGEDREARHVADQAVVAHICGAARDHARLRIRQEGGDHVLPLRKGVDRPEVDRALTPPAERGQDRRSGRGQRDSEADQGSEAHGRSRQESAAREPLRLERRASLDQGRGRDGLPAASASGLARPENSRADGDRAAHGDQQQVDDQPD